MSFQLSDMIIPFVSRKWYNAYGREFKMIKNKTNQIVLITALSLLACVLHGVMLFTPFNNYATTSIVKIILFVACPILYVFFSKDGTLKEMFLNKGDWKSIKISLLLGVGAFIVIIAGYAAIRPWLDDTMITGALNNVGITSQNYIFAVLYYVLINVALEEIFFRGFIFIAIYRLGHKWYAYLYSSGLFAIYHVAIMRYGVEPFLLVLATVGLAVVGLLFNYITQRCGNIIGSWAIHSGAGVAIGAIGFYVL